MFTCKPPGSSPPSSTRGFFLSSQRELVLWRISLGFFESRPDIFEAVFHVVLHVLGVSLKIGKQRFARFLGHGLRGPHHLTSLEDSRPKSFQHFPYNPRHWLVFVFGNFSNGVEKLGGELDL